MCFSWACWSSLNSGQPWKEAGCFPLQFGYKAVCSARCVVLIEHCWTSCGPVQMVHFVFFWHGMTVPCGRISDIYNIGRPLVCMYLLCSAAIQSARMVGDCHQIGGVSLVQCWWLKSADFYIYILTHGNTRLYCCYCFSSGHFLFLVRIIIDNKYIGLVFGLLNLE